MPIYDNRAGYDDLLHDIMQLLIKSSPQFPLLQVADMCRTAGLFNWQESQDLFKHGLFPDWFIEKLYSVLPRPVEIASLTSKNYEAFSLGKPRNLVLKPPISQSVNGNVIEEFASRSVSMPEIFITRGNHAMHYVSPWLNVSWSADGVIGPRKDPSARFFLNFLQNAESEHLPGRSFLGVVRLSSNYTNWLLNTVPRFLALIDAGEDIGLIDQFVLFQTRSDFQKKTLEEFGIGPERVINTKRQGRIFSTDEFIIVSDPCRDRIASANVYDLICSFFGQPRVKRRGKRKLFISRSKANRRRIINEDEVVAYLETLGYERIFMEDMSIRNAAEIMAEAEAVIAPHGAGLANLVFAKRGTKVLELFCAQITSTYWKISNQKKLKYYAFEADGPDGEKIEPDAMKNLYFIQRQLDMKIPMNNFIDFIENKFELK